MKAHLLAPISTPKETNFLSSHTAEPACKRKKENFPKNSLSCLSLKGTYSPSSLSWDAQIATRIQRNHKDVIFNCGLETGPPPPGRKSSCFVVFQSPPARITQHSRNEEQTQKPQNVTRTVQISVACRDSWVGTCAIQSPKSRYLLPKSSFSSVMRFIIFCSSPGMKFPLDVKIQRFNLQRELVSYSVAIGVISWLDP